MKPRKPQRLQSRQHGFSLLVLVGAIDRVGLALASLYQAASGAKLNVRTSERYAYGIELARSLLADNAMVAAGGVDNAGETSGGYEWRVQSSPVDLERTGMGRARLHNLEVGVAWFDEIGRAHV